MMKNNLKEFRFNSHDCDQFLIPVELNQKFNELADKMEYDDSHDAEDEFNDLLPEKSFWIMRSAKILLGRDKAKTYAVEIAERLNRTHPYINMEGGLAIADFSLSCFHINDVDFVADRIAILLYDRSDLKDLAKKLNQ